MAGFVVEAVEPIIGQIISFGLDWNVPILIVLIVDQLEQFLESTKAPHKVV